MRYCPLTQALWAKYHFEKKDGLDLVRLHDVMNGIENFFECADLDFTYKTDCATEYL
jgi:hypothetical protein